MRPISRPSPNRRPYVPQVQTLFTAISNKNFFTEAYTPKGRRGPSLKSIKKSEISVDCDDNELAIETSISKSIALERTTQQTKTKPKDPIITKSMKKIATTALKKMPGSNNRIEARNLDPKTNLKSLSNPEYLILYQNKLK